MAVSTSRRITKSEANESSARRPKYLQLAEQIRSQIEAGVRRPGDQLPSFAQMQAKHNLSQSTLEKMYRVLEQQKLIVREPGRGVYIAQTTAKQTGVLGLLADHVPQNHPYYVHLLAGTREAARRAGLEVLLLNDIRSVHWEKVDGVMIYAGFGYDYVLDALPPGMPGVAVISPIEGMPTVSTDDYQGMREAVQHLIALGHRRIGYLTSAVKNGGDLLSLRRMAAYRDVLAENGITVEPGWVRPLHGPYDPVQKFTGAGRDKMRSWLREDWHQLKLTALLMQNDDAAVGAIEVFQEAGIDVPGEVSVIGFDGTEIIEYFRPRLTTVHVPLEEIGRRGAQLLIDQMEQSTGNTPSPKSNAAPILLPLHLQVGDSSAPVRK